MLFRTAFSVAALLVAPFAMTTSAAAADVTFMMQNNHPNAVEVELYSQDRDHVWPGSGEVYVLDDGEAKQMPLACEEGEKICYGAWIQGDRETYWGSARATRKPATIAAIPAPVARPRRSISTNSDQTGRA